MTSYNVTIQLNATEQHFNAVFIMLYKMALPFEMKPTELYKVVLTFESVDEILKCDHSNESY